MTKPDWGRLTPTTYVKVWEACVLSVGLEPSSMKFEDDRWWKHKEETRPYITSKSFPTSEVEKNYKALFRDLAANLFEGSHFDVKDINNRQGKGYFTVSLGEFVRWATLNVKWLDLPPELAGLVIDKSNGDSNTPREVLLNKDKQTNLTKSTLQENPSRDIDLTREIEVAISQATEPDSDISVWTSLRNTALQGEGLFTGLVDEKGLHYVKSAGNGAAIFTKQALSKRLKRRRERDATKSR